MNVCGIYDRRDFVVPVVKKNSKGPQTSFRSLSCEFRCLSADGVFDVHLGPDGRGTFFERCVRVKGTYSDYETRTQTHVAWSVNSKTNLNKVRDRPRPPRVTIGMGGRPHSPNYWSLGSPSSRDL